MYNPTYKTSVKVVVGKSVAELEGNLEAALNSGYYITGSGGSTVTVLPEHHAFGGSTSLAVLVIKTEPIEAPEVAVPAPTSTPTPAETAPVTPKAVPTAPAPENAPQASPIPTPAADAPAAPEAPAQS